MGVILISKESQKIEVGNIFKQAFIELTSRMSCVELNEGGKQGQIEEGEKTSIMILTRGRFESYIVCSMNQELYEGIILGMNHGKPLEYEEKELYIKEYINIICGHGLSYINGRLGAASRLSVPYFGQGEVKDVKRPDTDQEETFSLDSAYGVMNITIDYKLSAAQTVT